ncbi:MAG: DUF192 domain-containing protein [Candidatus Parcubacteria bacterium]|nr:DUF192 domain-containing protein [Candidatus Parcubacteria bacterium]
MSKFSIIPTLSFCFLFVVAAILITFYFSKNKPKILFYNDFGFNIEYAITSQQRTKGLMGRENLNKDEAMFFVFPEQGIYGFWMKNMLIPIDIIWIDKDLKIIYIEHDVPPCKTDSCTLYKPALPSRYVLEIQAGLSQKLNMRIGDNFYFKK